MAKSSTYEVNPDDLSMLGRNVRNLHNEFEVPGLKKLKQWLDGSDAIKYPSVFNELAKALPEIVDEGTKKEMTKPKTLPTRTSWSEQSMTQEERRFLGAVSSKTVESVAAKMLLAMSDKDVTKEELSLKFTETIETYTKEVAAQTLLDLQRATILVKGKDGRVAPITVAEIDTLPISGEQKGFIKTSWHQGTFQAGFVAGALPVERIIESGKIPKETINDGILIDLSKESKVKIYSTSDGLSVPQEDPTQKSQLFSSAALSVDISDLAGDRFTPGMSTNPVKITAVVTEHDPDLTYGVKLQKPGDTKIHDYARESSIDGELQAILNSDPRATIAKDNIQKKIAVDDLVLPKLVDRIFDSTESEQIKIAKLEALKTIAPEKTLDAVRQLYSDRVYKGDDVSAESKLIKPVLGLDDIAIEKLTNEIKTNQYIITGLANAMSATISPSVVEVIQEPTISSASSQNSNKKGNVAKWLRDKASAIGHSLSNARGSSAETERPKSTIPQRGQGEVGGR